YLFELFYMVSEWLFYGNKMYVSLYKNLSLLNIKKSKRDTCYYQLKCFNNIFLAALDTEIVVCISSFNVSLLVPLNHGVISFTYFKFTSYLRCVLKKSCLH